jgi:hypothetical protein
MFAIARANWLLQASEALQLFAGLEAHGFAGRYIHFFAGARIAANAGFSRLYGENSEAAQFNPLAAAHAILQRLKNRFDGLLGLDAADACPFELRQYGVYDIQFNQSLPPLRTLAQHQGRCRTTVGRC